MTTERITFYIMLGVFIALAVCRMPTWELHLPDLIIGIGLGVVVRQLIETWKK